MLNFSILDFWGHILGGCNIFFLGNVEDLAKLVKEFYVWGVPQAADFENPPLRVFLRLPLIRKTKIACIRDYHCNDHPTLTPI